MEVAATAAFGHSDQSISFDAIAVHPQLKHGLIYDNVRLLRIQVETHPVINATLHPSLMIHPKCAHVARPFLLGEPLPWASMPTVNQIFYI